MSETANALVAGLMLLFASMYLGTGWSLVLFSFPLEPELTPQTYRLPFVEPVQRATKFFTYMTTAMMIAAAVLIFGEAGSSYVWSPIVYLLGVIVATALTIRFIFPYNKELEDGISDERRLHLVLGKWMRLNMVRASLWTVEWMAIVLYFVLKVA